MAVGNANEAVAPSLPASARYRAIGPVGFLFMGQLITLLIAVNGSTLLPGNWSPVILPMEVYLFIDAVAIGFFSQGVSVPLIVEGSVGRFLKVFVAFSAIGWVVVAALIGFTAGGTPTPVSPTVQFQDVVYIALFVGPTEELFFRVVLPPVLSRGFLGQMVWSSVAFALFHVGIYTAAGTQWTPLGVAGILVQLGLIGAIFFIVAWKPAPGRRDGRLPRWGYPAATGLHISYDLVVLGVIAALGGSAHLLGLVPL